MKLRRNQYHRNLIPKTIIFHFSNLVHLIPLVNHKTSQMILRPINGKFPQQTWILNTLPDKDNLVEAQLLLGTMITSFYLSLKSKLICRVNVPNVCNLRKKKNVCSSTQFTLFQFKPHELGLREKWQTKLSKSRIKKDREKQNVLTKLNSHSSNNAKVLV